MLSSNEEGHLPGHRGHKDSTSLAVMEEALPTHRIRQAIGYPPPEGHGLIMQMSNEIGALT